MYYISINRDLDTAIITKSKIELSRHLGVSVDTIYRLFGRFSDSNIIDYKGNIIVKSSEIHKQRKGGSRSSKRIIYQEMMSEAAKMISNQLDYEKYQQ